MHTTSRQKYKTYVSCLHFSLLLLYCTCLANKRSFHRSPAAAISSRLLVARNQTRGRSPGDKGQALRPYWHNEHLYPISSPACTPAETSSCVCCVCWAIRDYSVSLIFLLLALSSSVSNEKFLFLRRKGGRAWVVCFGQRCTSFIESWCHPRSQQQLVPRGRWRNKTRRRFWVVLCVLTSTYAVLYSRVEWLPAAASSFLYFLSFPFSYLFFSCNQYLIHMIQIKQNIIHACNWCKM
jgi:hypothetical protein